MIRHRFAYALGCALLTVSACAPAEPPAKSARDAFDDNRNTWPVGNSRTDSKRSFSRLANGVYRVEIDAQRPVRELSFGQGYPAVDARPGFRASVQVREAQTRVGSAGLVVFGGDGDAYDKQQWYFELRGNTFRIVTLLDGQQRVERDWTPTNAIVRGEPGITELTLEVQAEWLRASINGVQVAEIRSDVPLNSAWAKPGVVITAELPGDVSTFAFDELRIESLPGPTDG
jgi:hypothetical protein